MATVAEKTPVQEIAEANLAIATTMIEAGYKAQTRGLNIARVFVEGASRQQERGRKLLSELTDTNTPWYSPERYTGLMNVLVENQNETLRIGREYIDELNSAAAEGRQTVETLVKQAGQAREAQQAIFGQGVATFRQYAGNLQQQAGKAARG
jgi:hypothetical protein